MDRPKSTKLVLKREGNRALTLEVPPGGFRRAGAFFSAVSAIWFVFAGCAITVSSQLYVSGEVPWWSLAIAIGVAAVGFFPLIMALVTVFGTMRIRLENGCVLVRSECFGFARERRYTMGRYPRAEEQKWGERGPMVSIITASGIMHFGMTFSMDEAKGVAAELNAFLGEHVPTIPGMDSDSPPDGSKAVVQRDGASALTVVLPPRRFSGVAATTLVAGVCCLVPVAGLVVALLFRRQIVGDGESPRVPFWAPDALIDLALIAALVSVLLAGLVALYIAVRMARSTTMLRIEGRTLHLKRELFGRGRVREYRLMERAEAHLHEYWRINERPRYAIRLWTTSGDVTFGRNVPYEEQCWLVSQINKFLAGRTDA